ncbi:MAG: asparagine synthase (glutamine-hydrolyzing) [Bacillota bacterium]
MCGIAGWVDWAADLCEQKSSVENMVTALAHRGPDARAIWACRRAILGHCRLAVVDPLGGGQPMVRCVAGKLYVITYNGELYNTPELRNELELRGHVFQTSSDTEVLLCSYIEWGARCLEKLNGIYAFAVWDDQRQMLFLARDRLGVKPLFYTQQGSSFLFASELKGLLAHPLVSPVVDREGMAEVLALGPSRTPGHGVFRGIYELLPGCFLQVTPEGRKAVRYWQLISRPHTDSLEQTVENVRQLLEDSIKRQLVSDVPVGTLLSGGLDSSIITAVASRAMQLEGKPALSTFSIEFADDEKYFQADLFQPDADTPWVEQVAGYYQTEHHRVLVNPAELVDALAAAVRARDLPGMADIDASLLLFCRQIKQKVTVALSGECADEVFGGYPWFHRPELSGDTFPWIRGVEEKCRLLVRGLAADLDIAGYIRQRYLETLQQVPRLPGEKEEESRQRELTYLNLQWFMATLLDRKDRMSMASGLEVRVPFCDHRLVEYVWNIPWAWKKLQGREKGLLRRAMADLLPPAVLWRRKSPYPKTHHPAYRQAVRQWLGELLADAGAPLWQIADREAVGRLWHEEVMTGGDMPWFGQLMGKVQLMAYLLQIDFWLKTYRVRLVLD